MRGKVGLVIGLGLGYVLGTRAGRERYEQIKAQALKVWNLDPVQEQVGKAKEFAKSTAMAVPTALWNGVTKAVRGDEPQKPAASKPAASKPAASKPAADKRE